MGLREKVALFYVISTLIQIVHLRCTPNYLGKHQYKPKLVGITPKQKVCIQNQHNIFDTFRYPDVSYPVVSLASDTVTIEDVTCPEVTYPLEAMDVWTTQYYPRYAYGEKNAFKPCKPVHKPRLLDSVSKITTKTVDPIVKRIYPFSKQFEVLQKSMSFPKVDYPVIPACREPLCLKNVSFPEVEFPLTASDLWLPTTVQYTGISSLNEDPFKTTQPCKDIYNNYGKTLQKSTECSSLGCNAKIKYKSQSTSPTKEATIASPQETKNSPFSNIDKNTTSTLADPSLATDRSLSDNTSPSNDSPLLPIPNFETIPVSGDNPINLLPSDSILSSVSSENTSSFTSPNNDDILSPYTLKSLPESEDSPISSLPSDFPTPPFSPEILSSMTETSSLPTDDFVNDDISLPNNSPLSSLTTYDISSDNLQSPSVSEDNSLSSLLVDASTPYSPELLPSVTETSSMPSNDFVNDDTSSLSSLPIDESLSSDIFKSSSASEDDPISLLPVDAPTPFSPEILSSVTETYSLPTDDLKNDDTSPLSSLPMDDIIFSDTLKSLPVDGPTPFSPEVLSSATETYSLPMDDFKNDDASPLSSLPMDDILFLDTVKSLPISEDDPLSSSPVNDLTHFSPEVLSSAAETYSLPTDDFVNDDSTPLSSLPMDESLSDILKSLPAPEDDHLSSLPVNAPAAFSSEILSSVTETYSLPTDDFKNDDTSPLSSLPMDDIIFSDTLKSLPVSEDDPISSLPVDGPTPLSPEVLPSATETYSSMPVSEDEPLPIKDPNHFSSEVLPSLADTSALPTDDEILSSDILKFVLQKLKSLPTSEEKSSSSLPVENPTPFSPDILSLVAETSLPTDNFVNDDTTPLSSLPMDDIVSSGPLETMPVSKDEPLPALPVETPSSFSPEVISSIAETSSLPTDDFMTYDTLLTNNSPLSSMPMNNILSSDNLESLSMPEDNPFFPLSDDGPISFAPEMFSSVTETPLPPDLANDDIYHLSSLPMDNNVYSGTLESMPVSEDEPLPIKDPNHFSSEVLPSLADTSALPTDDEILSSDILKFVLQKLKSLPTSEDKSSSSIPIENLTPCSPEILSSVTDTSSLHTDDFMNDDTSPLSSLPMDDIASSDTLENLPVSEDDPLSSLPVDESTPFTPEILSSVTDTCPLPTDDFMNDDTSPLSSLPMDDIASTGTLENLPMSKDDPLSSLIVDDPTSFAPEILSSVADTSSLPTDDFMNGDTSPLSSLPMDDIASSGTLENMPVSKDDPLSSLPIDDPTSFAPEIVSSAADTSTLPTDGFMNDDTSPLSSLPMDDIASTGTLENLPMSKDDPLSSLPVDDPTSFAPEILSSAADTSSLPTDDFMNGDTSPLSSLPMDDIASSGTLENMPVSKDDPLSSLPVDDPTSFAPEILSSAADTSSLPTDDFMNGDTSPLSSLPMDDIASTGTLENLPMSKDDPLSSLPVDDPTSFEPDILSSAADTSSLPTDDFMNGDTSPLSSLPMDAIASSGTLENMPVSKDDPLSSLPIDDPTSFAPEILSSAADTSTLPTDDFMNDDTSPLSSLPMDDIASSGTLENLPMSKDDPLSPLPVDDPTSFAPEILSSAADTSSLPTDDIMNDDTSPLSSLPMDDIASSGTLENLPVSKDDPLSSLPIDDPTSFAPEILSSAADTSNLPTDDFMNDGTSPLSSLPMDDIASSGTLENLPVSKDDPLSSLPIDAPTSFAPEILSSSLPTDGFMNDDTSPFSSLPIDDIAPSNTLESL